jgi:hypothetical protein
MTVPLLFGIMIIAAIMKGQNPDGTFIPHWQKIFGIIFAIILCFGSLGGLIWLMNGQIEKCLSQNTTFGYKYTPFSSLGTYHIGAGCI